MFVLFSYCVFGMFNFVVCNIVFIREDASDGVIRADVVWGYFFFDVLFKLIVVFVDEDVDCKFFEDCVF